MITGRVVSLQYTNLRSPELRSFSLRPSRAERRKASNRRCEDGLERAARQRRERNRGERMSDRQTYELPCHKLVLGAKQRMKGIGYSESAGGGSPTTCIR